MPPQVPEPLPPGSADGATFEYVGIGLGRESKEALLARARGSHHARTRWEAARVLVVDEVGSLQPYVIQPAALCGPVCNPM